MKFKSTSLILLLAITPIVLTSCETDETSTPAYNLTEQAEVLTDLLIGDTLNYTPIAEFLPIAPIVFDSINVASYTDIDLQHSKTQTHEFQLTGKFIAAEQDFDSAVSTLLSTEGALPGTGGAIDDPFRQILFKPDQTTADFSNVEMQDMADQIVAAGGGFVLIHPTENYMFIVDDILIEHESLSDNADLISGRMSGEYKISALGRRVHFRRPTSAEFSGSSSIRLITSQHWIPVIQHISISIISIEGYDFGTFELQFANTGAS